MDKYKSELRFMVSRDYYYMEVVEPISVWVPDLPYKLDEFERIGLANIMLRKPRDTIVERFGTYKEKSSKL